MNRSRIVLMVLVLGVLVVLAGLMIDSGTGPYRLDDTSPRGYAGLAEVLRRLDVEVDEVDLGDLEPAAGDTVFVPKAQLLSEGDEDRLRDLAVGGARVVLGGLPGVGTLPLQSQRPVVFYQSPGDCTMPDLLAIDGLDRIDTADQAPLDPPEAALWCYGDRSAAYVVEEPVRDGTVITLASPELFVNDAMRELDEEADEAKGPMADNVVLAVGVLAPEGTQRLVVVSSGFRGAPVASDDPGGLLAHMPTGVKLGLWQAAAALALFALICARRFGRVVDEPLPVTIAGSELVLARAGLMERRRDPAHAAAAIRADAIRHFGEELGLGRGASLAVIAPVLATRTGREPAEIAALLGGQPVDGDAGLIRLVHQLDRLRKELHHDLPDPTS